MIKQALLYNDTIINTNNNTKAHHAAVLFRPFVLLVVKLKLDVFTRYPRCITTAKTDPSSLLWWIASRPGGVMIYHEEIKLCRYKLYYILVKYK